MEQPAQTIYAGTTERACVYDGVPMTLRVAHQAIVHLDLAGELPVSAMADFLRVIDEVYRSNIYIDLAHSADHSTSDLSRFEPTNEQRLLTHQADIGTPNFAELLGLTEPLIHTCSLIGAALGIAKIGISVLKTWAETQKVKAEVRKLAAETEKLSLESKVDGLVARAPASLSKEDAANLEQLQQMVHAVSEKLLKRYITNIELRLVEEQEMRVASSAEDAPVTLRIYHGAGLPGERVLVPNDSRMAER
jgi:hypothetical protein